MTIHVNIGEAKARLSELVAAAVRGEDIILNRAGSPQVRLTPVHEVEEERLAEIGRKRRAAFGMFREEAKGFDLSIDALKQDRVDWDERFRRKFGAPD